MSTPFEDPRPPLSDAETTRLREAGRILRAALDAVCDAVRPGITGLELDAIAADAIARHGATSAFTGYAAGGDVPYPAALCVSPGDVVVHGIPSARGLVAGEIVSLDLGAVYEGLYADAARTLIVPGAAEDERLSALLQGTREAIDDAVATLRPGVSTEELAQAVHRRCISRRLYAVAQTTGHGVGHALHEEPTIPNVPLLVAPTLLLPGRAYAIEPVLLERRAALRIDDDGWTIRTVGGIRAAHFERTVLMDDEGRVEIIAD